MSYAAHHNYIHLINQDGWIQTCFQVKISRKNPGNNKTWRIFFFHASCFYVKKKIFSFLQRQNVHFFFIVVVFVFTPTCSSSQNLLDLIILLLFYYYYILIPLPYTRWKWKQTRDISLFLAKSRDGFEFASRLPQQMNKIKMKTKKQWIKT